jgi:hypothetical protein
MHHTWRLLERLRTKTQQQHPQYQPGWQQQRRLLNESTTIVHRGLNNISATYRQHPLLHPSRHNTASATKGAITAPETTAAATMIDLTIGPTVGNNQADGSVTNKLNYP